MKIIEAIARMEGFYTIGSRSARNNNPGDIEFGKFAKKHGAIGGDPRFAIFPSPNAGFAAMRALLNGKEYLGLTLSAALNKWAPSVENQTNIYIEHVCAWTDLMRDTILTAENIG